MWPKLCIKHDTTTECANDNFIGGKRAKASPLIIFRGVYGTDLVVDEMTQY